MKQFALKALTGQQNFAKEEKNSDDRMIVFTAGADRFIRTFKAKPFNT